MARRHNVWETGHGARNGPMGNEIMMQKKTKMSRYLVARTKHPKQQEV